MNTRTVLASAALGLGTVLTAAPIWAQDSGRSPANSIEVIKDVRGLERQGGYALGLGNVLALKNNNVVVCNTYEDRITVLSETGETLASHALKNLEGCSAGIVNGEEKIYAYAKIFDTNLLELSNSGQVLKAWKLEDIYPDFTALTILKNGTLAFSTWSNGVYFISPHTGKVQFSFVPSGNEHDGDFRHPVIAYGDWALITSHSGNVYLVDPAPFNRDQLLANAIKLRHEQIEKFKLNKKEKLYYTNEVISDFKMYPHSVTLTSSGEIILSQTQAGLSAGFSHARLPEEATDYPRIKTLLQTKGTIEHKPLLFPGGLAVVRTHDDRIVIHDLKNQKAVATIENDTTVRFDAIGGGFIPDLTPVAIDARRFAVPQRNGSYKVYSTEGNLESSSEPSLERGQPQIYGLPTMDFSKNFILLKSDSELTWLEPSSHKILARYSAPNEQDVPFSGNFATRPTLLSNGTVVIGAFPGSLLFLRMTTTASPNQPAEASK